MLSVLLLLLLAGGAALLLVLHAVPRAPALLPPLLQNLIKAANTSPIPAELPHGGLLHASRHGVRSPIPYCEVSMRG